jgi:cytochrome oxidase Cu insertion factor (SCO1/SenC/PrrC family)
MVTVLLAGWRQELVDTLRHLASTARGRLLAGTVTLVLGLTAAGVRVAGVGVPEPELGGPADVPDTYPRLDRPFPHVEGLVDQHGAPFSLASLDGRGALVTFVFAHCETIYPLLVRSSLAVRDELAPEMELAEVALTLDPWRDTPSRLADMAAKWSLPEGDFVVSGSVEAVETALDAWKVSRVPDPKSGDVTPPALVYLVEPDGTVAYASTGAPPQLETLARRMRGPSGTDPRRLPVVVLGSERMLRSAVDNLTDLFLGIPGLDGKGVDPVHRRPVIRGMRGQRVLLLEDGLRLNNA